MGIFSAIGGFISGIFAPAADLIDNLHTSEEEKGKIRIEIARIQGEVLNKTTELEMARLDAVSKVQVAESQSKFWITAAWRPMASLMFVIVITLSSFGIIPKPEKEFYDIAMLFLNVYSGGRSLEKFGSVLKLGK